MDVLGRIQGASSCNSHMLTLHELLFVVLIFALMSGSPGPGLEIQVLIMGMKVPHAAALGNLRTPELAARHISAGSVAAEAHVESMEQQRQH
jgi:hypothetical protein